jgi:ATP-dependent DNA helicase RecG
MVELKTQADPPKLTRRTSIRYLKGVGPEKQKILARLGLATISDLYYFFPRRYEKRFPIKKIAELSFTGKECVAGEITRSAFVRRRGGRGFFKVVVSDGKQSLEVIFYHQAYLASVFPLKSRALFYGKAEMNASQIRMIHPEYEVFQGDVPKETVHTGRWTPVYPLTEDLSQKTIRQILYRTIHECEGLIREGLGPDLRKRHSLAGLPWAFREIHFPSGLSALHRAYERLVFDEFFALELMLQMKRAELRKENKDLAHGDGETEFSQWRATLPFKLTAGQQKALDEIRSDMKSGRPMNRLIQGDVGSGKTVVAAGALFFTVKNGFQGALMAPTEVLAQQLYFQMRQLLEASNIVCGYLSQSIDDAEKEKTLRAVASGEIQVAVGTHALIGEKTHFRRLGLAIVDEQHKFGVFQRKALKEKGFSSAHFLLMTATPIPRTLSMTLYGDMDVSVIAERPPGRLSVKTYWVGNEKREAVYRWLDALIGEGAQAYVVCPQIDSDASGVTKNAVESYERLSKIFPQRRLSLLHGRMKNAEKNKIMQAFREKQSDILVATVVVEVGMDVPNARCILIENAEQFGLAQLHQLRGRVGRGTAESYCILFSESEGAGAAQRLSAFESMDSGFEIAEEDLEQRGAGEFFGQKQHGLPGLRIGDLSKDRAILMGAKEEARRTVESDARLEFPEHRLLKQMVQERFTHRLSEGSG